MKVPLHIVQNRRDRLAGLIAHNGYMPVSELCSRLGVSEATARRDLAALASQKRIKRTHGGAVADFDNRFPSFAERCQNARSAKAKIASASLCLFTPGSTCFMDSGTTMFAIAEAFRDKPVTPISIITSNIPVGEMLAAVPGVEVFLLAGRLLPRQSALLGEAAERSLEFWRFDLALFSAEGMDESGIWNSTPAVVSQQQAAARRAAKSVLCLDSSKLGGRAPEFLLSWDQVDLLLTEVPWARLMREKIPLRPDQYWSALERNRPSPEPSSPQNESLPVHML